MKRILLLSFFLTLFSVNAYATLPPCTVNGDEWTETGTRYLCKVNGGDRGWIKKNYVNKVNVNQYSSALTDVGLNAAIAGIGVNPVTLLIDQNYVISNAVTFPSNIDVQFVNSGNFEISANVNVTFNGELIAELDDIFSGTYKRNVVFNENSTKELYVDWWGAVGDASTTNNQDELEDAFTVAIKNKKIAVLNGTYFINASITLDSTDTGSTSSFSFDIVGKNNARIQALASMAYMMRLGGATDGWTGFTIRDLMFHGSGLATDGLDLAQGTNSNYEVQNVYFFNITDECVRTGNWLIRFENARFSTCGTAISIPNGRVANNIVIDNSVIALSDYGVSVDTATVYDVVIKNSAFDDVDYNAIQFKRGTIKATIDSNYFEAVGGSDTSVEVNGLEGATPVNIDSVIIASGDPISDDDYSVRGLTVTNNVFTLNTEAKYFLALSRVRDAIFTGNSNSNTEGDGTQPANFLSAIYLFGGGLVNTGERTLAYNNNYIDGLTGYTQVLTQDLARSNLIYGFEWDYPYLLRDNNTSIEIIDRLNSGTNYGIIRTTVDGTQWINCATDSATHTVLQCIPTVTGTWQLGSSAFRLSNVYANTHTGGIFAGSELQAPLITGDSVSSKIVQNTADGTDTNAWRICGGGDNDPTRGACVVVYGNEHATYPGKIRLITGEAGEINIPNDVWIEAVDNAGTGVVNAMKVNTSDEVEIGADMITGAIQLQNSYISNDGDSEGISIDNSGIVSTTGHTNTAGKIENVTDLNAATYTALVTDENISVRYTLTAAVTDLELPDALCDGLEDIGRVFNIIDTGNLSTTNKITVKNTADATLVEINGNGDAITVICLYNGSSYIWKIK